MSFCALVDLLVVCVCLDGLAVCVKWMKCKTNINLVSTFFSFCFIVSCCGSLPFLQMQIFRKRVTYFQSFFRSVIVCGCYSTGLVADLEKLCKLMSEFGRMFERSTLRVNVDCSRVIISLRNDEQASVRLNGVIGRSFVFLVCGLLREEQWTSGN